MRMSILFSSHRSLEDIKNVFVENGQQAIADKIDSFSLTDNLEPEDMLAFVSIYERYLATDVFYNVEFALDEDDDEDMGDWAIRDFEFSYDDLLKKVWLGWRTRYLSSASGFNAFKVRMIALSDFEKTIGKPIFDFTIDEFYSLLSRLVNVYSAPTLGVIIAVYKSYHEVGGDNSKFEGLAQRDILQKIGISKRKYVELEQLQEYIMESENPMFASIPLLLFSGLSCSKNDIKNKNDELVFLKWKDVIEEDGKYYIDIKTSHTPRIIPIAKSSYLLLKRSYEQVYPIYASNSKLADKAIFIQSEYIQKGVENNRTKPNQPMSFPGVYMRFNIFADWYEAAYGEKITMTRMRESGKIYYLKRALEEEQLSPREACISVLKRFGDWANENDTEETSSNRSAISRLRSIYVASGNKIGKDKKY